MLEDPELQSNPQKYSWLNIGNSDTFCKAFDVKGGFCCN